MATQHVIYTVNTGDLSQGGSAVSFHKTIEGARQWAAESIKGKDGWERTDENTWVNDCDYVLVACVELKA